MMDSKEGRRESYLRQRWKRGCTGEKTPSLNKEMREPAVPREKVKTEPSMQRETLKKKGLVSKDNAQGQGEDSQVSQDLTLAQCTCSIP